MKLSMFPLLNWALVSAQLTTNPLYSATSNIATSTSSSVPAIFTVPSDADNGQNLLPNIKDPQAVNAQSVCPGYIGSSVTRTANGLTAQLTLAGPACNVYGTDINDLNLTVEYQAKDRLHVLITPTYVGADNSSWFILPEALVPSSTAESDVGETDLEFTWSNSPTFSFAVIRRSNGDTLFTTNGTQLVYENQFIEFISALPDQYNLYGLGEVIHNLRMGNNFTRTFYAADVGDPVDTNLYGTHPFYLDTRYFEVNPTTGKETYAANATNSSAEYVSYSHGLFQRNSHGQEVLMQPSNITWRTLGGAIDLTFYAGPTQAEVTKSYQTSTVGLPAMQQYFTFGYHQCRWGYKSWSQLQDVVDNFEKFGLPLDNIWTDIDYMQNYRDFTTDSIGFDISDGQAFLSQIHAKGLHYIPIFDSAIYIPNPMNASDAYAPFERGNATDSFILNPDGSLYIGDVWPGFTVFPDWIGSTLNGTGAGDWWIDEVTRFHSDISFDGIWIDMSEVSSFCVGSCGSGNNPATGKPWLSSNPVHPPFLLPGEPGAIIYSYPENFASTNGTEASSISSASSVAAASSASVASEMSATMTGVVATTTPYLRTTPTPGVRDVNYPPYVINHVNTDLAVHAVSPNATHHGGSVEYDYHNLFGHEIINATYHALLNIKPLIRPFIIGRSTFAGSGKWAGHWGGDNASQFFYMMMSIPQALSFSLFGVPMFGVDTCGFNGNTDEELCNRWMQLSAFFPFYRNHNVLSAISQEPYIWASVTEATKIAAGIRYLLLPYIYTTFWQAHTTGSTVMRALAWEFPNDPTLASADRQFLLGPSLLITPVLEQGATNVSGVFPGADKGEIWYDWYNQSAVTNSIGNVTLDAPLGHIPVFIRGGSVLPTQEAALTTTASRKNPWGLLVALNGGGAAAGSLYIDDGESLTPNKTLIVEFTAQNSILYASGRGLYTDNNTLANVTVMGVQSAPTSVMLNAANLTSGWSYNSSSFVLQVTQLGNLTGDGAWSSDWVLKWS